MYILYSFILKLKPILYLPPKQTFIFLIDLITLSTRYSEINFNQKLLIKLDNFLFKDYLQNEYHFLISNSLSDTIRYLNDDTSRVINGIIQPFFFIITTLILIFFISILFLIINLKVN